jgi:cytolysin-activating lysine-acyltransferase
LGHHAEGATRGLDESKHPVVTGADPNPQELGERFLKSLDKAQLGAAASKLVAASIGDMVVVLSRSPAHKHCFLADIEWMVLPPVFAGQFYIAEAAHKERGVRAPIAIVTWALVSKEIDARLREAAGQRVRLRPDEWKSGDIGWLIDAVGDGKGLDAALQWLKAGPFKERPLNLVTQGKQGSPVASTLETLMADRAGSSA